MKLQEVLILEKNHQNIINLVRDGIFWRAYERSAYHFVNNLKNYSLTKKQVKLLNQEVVYLGFPDTALAEILEIAANKGFSVSKDEKVIMITGFENTEGFELWKNEISVYQKNHSEVMVSEPVAKYDNDIVGKIRKFPIAERTPLDCQKFIIELQSMINGTI